MKRYKVLFGDHTGNTVVGENLSKEQANELYKELMYNGDMFMSPDIFEYDIFDIKEERRKKLERLNQLNEKIF